MANFCKTCGHPVRRDGARWIHYDEHITHPVVLVISREKFTHSVEQARVKLGPTRRRGGLSTPVFLILLFLMIWLLDSGHTAIAAIVAVSAIPIAIFTDIATSQ